MLNVCKQITSILLADDLQVSQCNQLRLTNAKSSGAVSYYCSRGAVASSVTRDKQRAVVTVVQRILAGKDGVRQ